MCLIFYPPEVYIMYSQLINYVKPEYKPDLEAELRLAPVKKPKYVKPKSANPRKPRNNTTKYDVRGSTGYKGVSVDGTRFKARVYHMNQHINLGRFATALEAAKAHDVVAKELFGNKAILNFKD